MFEESFVFVFFDVVCFGEGWIDCLVKVDDFFYIFFCEFCGDDQEFYIGYDSLCCFFCGFVKLIFFDEEMLIEEWDYYVMLCVLEVKFELDVVVEGVMVCCEFCFVEVFFEGVVILIECVYCGIFI